MSLLKKNVNESTCTINVNIKLANRNVASHEFSQQNFIPKMSQ